ncbi:MAG: hypothetical protein Q9191_002265 [Dirinaria sp. TL-2023a]
MSNSPRPQYFVAREEGTLTPLIAVDELPPTVHIAGVPAKITHADTQNMISLGVKERSSQRYVVSMTDQAPRTPAKSAAAPLDGEIKSSTAENGGAAKPSVEKWRRGVKTKAPVQVETPRTNGEKESETSEEVDEDMNADHPKSKSPREAPRFTTAIPSQAGAAGAGTKGTLGRKLYCTHWIRWGECDYTQQGCLYKHEMPDEKTLNEIGIATYPRWYRIANPEKFGGITEVPEWHRRPGPAPTDQLWRGGAAAVAARAIAPQSWEEFRQSSKLATVPRYPNQVGQSNGGASPNAVPSAFFTLNTYPGTFNSWNGGFIQQQQASRSPYGKAPFPRVLNMDTPFANKSNQNPVNPSADGENNVGDQAKDQVNRAVTAEKESSSTESSSAFTQQPTADMPASSTSAQSTLDQETGMPTELIQSTPVVNLPKLSTLNSESIIVPSIGTDNPSSPEVRSAIDKVHRPLVPSPVPQGPAVMNGNTQQQSGSGKLGAPFVAAPKTPPPIHRRFFVPAGEARYVANKQVSSPPGPAPTNGSAGKPRKGSKKGGRTNVSELLLNYEDQDG